MMKNGESFVQQHHDPVLTLQFVVICYDWFSENNLKTVQRSIEFLFVEMARTVQPRVRYLCKIISAKLPLIFAFIQLQLTLIHAPEVRMILLHPKDGNVNIQLPENLGSHSLLIR